MKLSNFRCSSYRSLAEMSPLLKSISINQFSIGVQTYSFLALLTTPRTRYIGRIISILSPQSREEAANTIFEQCEYIFGTNIGRYARTYTTRVHLS